MISTGLHECQILHPHFVGNTPTSRLERTSCWLTLYRVGQSKTGTTRLRSEWLIESGCFMAWKVVVVVIFLIFFLSHFFLYPV
jgi:hypothetical protein